MWVAHQDLRAHVSGEGGGCHEMMTRAARLECSGFVTLARPVSNVLISRGSQHDILKDSATLLQ